MRHVGSALFDRVVGAVPAIDTPAVLSSVLAFAVGFLVVFLLGRYVLEPVLDRALRRKEAFTERGLRTIVVDVVDAFVVLFAAWTGLHVAGFGGLISATAAVGAAGTVVVGVAARDALANFADGVFMAADPEFDVGDWIEVGDVEGEVVDVGIRATRIRTFRNRLVTVPNSDLGTAAVVNHSASDRIRGELRVGVGYDEPVKRVRELLCEEATAHRDVLVEPAPNALTVDYGDSALVVDLVYWVDPADRPAERAVRSDLAERVVDRLAAEGVSMPGPHRELSGEVTVSTTGESPAGDDAPASGSPADEG